MIYALSPKTAEEPEIFDRLQIPFNPNNQKNLIWQSPYLITDPKQELMLDGAYYQEAKRTMVERKIDFIKVSLERVLKLWFPETIEFLSVNFYLYVMELLLMFCGILFLMSRCFPVFCGKITIASTSGIWFVISIFSIQLPHLFYNVYSRMRRPLQPVIILLAIYGLYSLLVVYSRKHRPTEENPGM